eukprot:scaffold3184_cov105-Isochrysis_galbana.AAC.2
MGARGVGAPERGWGRVRFERRLRHQKAVDGAGSRVGRVELGDAQVGHGVAGGVANLKRLRPWRRFRRRRPGRAHSHQALGGRGDEELFKRFGCDLQSSTAAQHVRQGQDVGRQGVILLDRRVRRRLHARDPAATQAARPHCVRMKLLQIARRAHAPDRRRHLVQGWAQDAAAGGSVHVGRVAAAPALLGRQQRAVPVGLKERPVRWAPTLAVNEAERRAAARHARGAVARRRLVGAAQGADGRAAVDIGDHAVGAPATQP